MWAHFEPRGGQYYGPNWLGPSIFHYGTEEQKAKHLPEIARGHGLWCQGFSEPDAGSDLANMATKAVPDGDGFRISGQKTWTSWALWAEWCYLLARVEGFGDGNSKKEGITVFLVPMDRDGITVRGLDGIPGPHHLNEVFFDDVWVDRSEVLGDLGAGWQVIRDALSNERVGIARYARDDRLLSMVLADEEFRAALPARRWVEARVRNRMSRLMCRRALWFQRDGGSHDFIVVGRPHDHDPRQPDRLRRRRRGGGRSLLRGSQDARRRRAAAPPSSSGGTCRPAPSPRAPPRCSSAGSPGSSSPASASASPRTWRTSAPRSTGSPPPTTGPTPPATPSSIRRCARS